MTNYSNQCFRCRFFDRYYLRSDDRFQKTKFGYCHKNKKNTDIHDSCKDHVLMNRPRFRFDPLIDTRLDHILTEIAVLRDLIGEDERENL